MYSWRSKPIVKQALARTLIKVISVLGHGQHPCIFKKTRLLGKVMTVVSER